MEVTENDYLLPEVREILKLSDIEKCNHIRASHWVGYMRAYNCLDKLEELRDYPKTTRMPNLLIIGPTNNGKSMIIEYFKSKRSNLTDSPLAEIILDKSSGIIGEMATLIKRAAIFAVMNYEERITEKIINKISFQSPSERAKLFEGELIT